MVLVGFWSSFGFVVRFGLVLVWFLVLLVRLRFLVVGLSWLGLSVGFSGLVTPPSPSSIRILVTRPVKRSQRVPVFAKADLGVQLEDHKGSPAHSALLWTATPPFAPFAPLRACHAPLAPSGPD